MDAAVCCNSNVGLDFDGGLQIGDSVADVKVIRRPNLQADGRAKPPTLIEQIEQAFQKAIHPDRPLAPGEYAANIPGGGMFPAVGGNVIPFPVVSPYRPLTKPGSPVTGLTAFPKSGYYFNGEPVNNFNPAEYTSEDDEVLGYESLSGTDKSFQSLNGLGDVGCNSGIGLPQDNSSLGALGMKWEGIIGQITQTIPSIISAGKGQQYYDPSGNVNPQLGPPQIATQGGREAPEGYYYDERGALQKLGSQVGAGAGNILQGVSDFVTENPLIVLAGGAALMLLFMSPPRRR